MPELPPKELVATLESLRLATAGQVAAMGRRVRRLAGDLPRFESVWVDALAQARLLTPYQATELNAGRGRRLRVGDYVLCERLPYPLYTQGFRARHVETREMARLALMESPSPPAPLPKGEGSMESPSPPAPLPKGEGSMELPSPPAPLPKGEGSGEPATPTSPITILPSPRFAAEPWVNGITAAEWMVKHGRFPPQVVLEIARAMLVRLVEWEKSGVCHGDVCAGSLILTDAGGVDLPWPGLRGQLRPEEGYAYVDLPPEAFDGLSPERILSGGPPTIAGDIFACGCLWWHLLCGRPPLAGGDGLAKLQAIDRCEIRDVREYAPDAPAPLSAAISACVQRAPNHRPESMARLAAMLGPPTRDGRDALIGVLNRGVRPAVRWTTAARTARKSPRTPLWFAAAACSLATIVALCWPGIGRQDEFSGRRHAGPEMAEHGDKPPEFNRAAVELNRRDAVVPAVYQQPAGPPMELVLAADGPTPAAAIRLCAGQHVRAPSGRRAVVLVPHGGLPVAEENVRFEDIDFRWDGSIETGATAGLPDSAENTVGQANRGTRQLNANAALVRLTASEAVFQGCRFFNGDSSIAPHAAIRWDYPPASARTEISLPSGRITLVDCLIGGVEAGIDCRTLGAAGIHLTNVLHLGPGPLVRLDRCPGPDEPVSLAMSQSTVRGGTLLECFVADAAAKPGEIKILADACVFAPPAGLPLARVHCAEPPRFFLDCLNWTGQGSVVTPAPPILAWRGPNGRERSVDESALSIAGLVRGEVRYAGVASDDPESSRITRWQAPLQSAAPPGIGKGGGTIFRSGN